MLQFGHRKAQSWLIRGVFGGKSAASRADWRQKAGN
jgi:hypothetical protein